MTAEGRSPREEASRHLACGVEHHAAARLDEAEAAYGRVLELVADHADALHLLGVIAHQRDEHERALALISRAIERRGDDARYHCNLGNVLRALGRLEAGLACFGRALELDARLLAAQRNFALALAELGRYDELAAHLDAIRELVAGDAFFRTLAGMAHAELGRLDEAVAAYREALRLEPRSGEALTNLGAALVRAGRPDEAMPFLRAAVRAAPDLAPASYNLGVGLAALGQWSASLASCDRALELAPDFAQAHTNRALALWKLERAEEAFAAGRRALALDDDLPEAHVIVGNLCKDWGQVREAVDCYRRALEIDPSHLPARSNLILSLHYLPDHGSAEVLDQIREWNRLHTAGSVPRESRLTKSARAAKRLSIGYVSSNLRTHPGGFFLGAVIAAHDRSTFRVSCYADLTAEDELSQRIAASCDAWVPIRRLGDAALAERIRRDGIDILVDMNRFAGEGRLPAFARRPAPVQVSWMGGPITTTGLETIDYLLSDFIHTPPGHEALFVEKVVRLDNAYGVYAPPPYLPAVGLLPALARGFVTFGCFNYLAKLQPPVLALWSRILRELDDARLLLQSKAFDHAEPRRRILASFVNEGVEPERIELRGALSHRDLLALYNRVDIALDPFPYSGGVSTCEALWMGVPVIAHAGVGTCARHSVSHLANARLEEFIADDDAGYRAAAEAWANDPSSLASLRSQLRDRVSTSRLGDAAAFARQLEAAYRRM